jgi:hypothetical protein
VSVNTLMNQLEREPGEMVVDPWVIERATLVAEPQRTHHRLPQVDLMDGPADLHQVISALRGPLRTGCVRLAMYPRVELLRSRQEPAAE